MLNKVTLMGRFARDPELRQTTSGTPCASFALAVERDFVDQATGKRECDFIDCVAWKTTADFVSKYFSKGSMAAIVGRLQVRPWQDKQGNKRRAVEVIVENIYFGASKKEDAAPAPSYAAAPRPVEPGDDFSMLEDEDTQLPF